MYSLSGIISKELNIGKKQTEATICLLDDGNTVPFISRYRKEITGSLSEVEIRYIEDRTKYLRNLESRKNDVIRLIDEQDKLTDDLEKKIRDAIILQEIEDLYRPYKQRRRTRAVKAKQKGLEPLAKLIWAQDIIKGKKEVLLNNYINIDMGIQSIEDASRGARDIIAEWISDDAEIRKEIREISLSQGLINSNCKNEKPDNEGKYELYYDYKESIKKIPSHRILALNRGENEGFLQIKILVSEEKIYDIIKRKIIIKESIFQDELLFSIEDAYKRLIAPSIEREIRNTITDKAEKHAIEIFSENLKSLLLQPPLRNHVIMGIDPGFRTGSKVCVVNETGKLLDITTIYPHISQNKEKEAKEKIIYLIEKYNINTIAIGNGTASRETELFIAQLINEFDSLINYTIVNEAGASVYSASDLAREEFPDLDVSLRGAVSIARRLQDSLSELVKINPRSIGVGMYQHDVNSNLLEDSLSKVVESAVNFVGVDVNTASPALLEYVSGINNRVARSIVNYREKEGIFTIREELNEVPFLGKKIFTQAAGFLRILRGRNPLESTPIHPESYESTKLLLLEMGFKIEELINNDKIIELREKLNNIDIKEKARALNIGIPTLKDIIKALRQPGRDPRDESPKPVFRTDVLKLEDLKSNMLLQGTVRNVVDFGIFVDIGVKEDGLVHISEISYDYVENPFDIVKVGDIINVKILDVDMRRRRIALSMK
jgi:protein Tex